MRTVRVVKPNNQNMGIVCHDCDLPMPVTTDSRLIEIDWGLITLPIGWTERTIRATTALKGAVKNVESRVYFCPTCWVKYDASSLVPIPDPSLDKIEKALSDYISSTSKSKTIEMPVEHSGKDDDEPESSTKPSVI